MKELQAKAKVTQTMTRDGLVVENQADGTVENISSREAEQDYSTDSEGKTEKILERTEDVKDKHKAKKKPNKLRPPPRVKKACTVRRHVWN